MWIYYSHSGTVTEPACPSTISEILAATYILSLVRYWFTQTIHLMDLISCMETSLEGRPKDSYLKPETSMSRDGFPFTKFLSKLSKFFHIFFHKVTILKL